MIGGNNWLPEYGMTAAEYYEFQKERMRFMERLMYSDLEIVRKLREEYPDCGIACGNIVPPETFFECTIYNNGYPLYKWQVYFDECSDDELREGLEEAIESILKIDDD